MKVIKTIFTDFPTQSISERNIKASYYYDLSGQIEITDNNGEQIFFKEDGRLPNHIEYLEEAIDDLERLYKNNLNIYKRALVMLKGFDQKKKK